MTFSEQSECFLAQIASRKRNPVKPGTVKSYRSQLKTWAIPALGELDLAQINNKTLKDFAGLLVGAELAPSSIRSSIFLAKSVVASAIDENGNKLYPRDWNDEFIDAPVVEGQDAPVINAQEIEAVLAKATNGSRALFVVLAGTGMRPAEALALGVGPDNGQTTTWDPAESVIHVYNQRHTDGSYGPTKSEAGVRKIDLPANLNDYLKKAFPDCKGLMFPKHYVTYLIDLRDCDIDYGLHCFRRFRERILELNNVPRMLMKFWAGHEAEDITERYIKLGSELQARRQWAEHVGLGFKLIDKETT